MGSPRALVVEREVGLAERGQRRERTAVRAESIRDASHMSIPTSPQYEARGAIATELTSTWLYEEPGMQVARLVGIYAASTQHI
jgi:hypothetical protein